MSRTSAQVDRARRRIHADLRRAIDEVASGRRGSGLSLRAVGATCGVSHSAIDRMEAHRADSVDLVLLASMAASVGLDLRLQIYPAGDPIRDAGQERLVGRLKARLHPSLRWRTEVTLSVDGDLRAWDAVITGQDWRCHVEAETVLDDLQAVERRLERKRRDGGADHVIVLVADIRRNRRALDAAPAAFGGFSRDARRVLGALHRGIDPGCDAIMLL